MSATNSAIKNKLLSSLVSTTSKPLLPHLEEVSLTAGRVVHQSGEIITEIYFPQTAICSLAIEMLDKSQTQICLIGCEGAIGLPAIFGSNLLNTSSMVQISGTALKVPTEVIKREFDREKNLHQILLLYIQTRLANTSQIAVCNSVHNIEQKLARLLLFVRDCIEQDTLPLTQKSISLILGVRRASITETAILLQKQQIIKYNRGKITIVDDRRLKAIACECYSKINSEYERLLNTKLDS